MFATVNVHFLLRSDEKLTVNENIIILDKISLKYPFNNPLPLKRDTPYLSNFDKNVICDKF